MRRAIAVGLVCCLVSSPVTAQVAEKTPSIRVSGIAAVKLKPDRVIVQFGIETIDRDIAKAKQKNRQLYEQTVAAIKSVGVSQENIQTDHLSIKPRYDRSRHRDDLIGYAAGVSLAVALDDPSKIEELVTIILKAGVNELNSVIFETREYKKHRDEARRLALLAAREKAEKMAATLNMKIGAPLTIEERAVETRGRYRRWNSASIWSSIQNTAVDVPSDADDGPLALGKISIRASVGVTFALEKK